MSPAVESLAGLLPAGTPSRRPRLLVVDDQPTNVQALYRLFAADHQVFMATCAAQALQVAAARQPDLVLLDLEMPDMDGYEVCRRLKADATTRDAPVIFVTAHGEADAETRGLGVGAVDFITKPFNPSVVRARVRTHLTLKRQTDLLRQWVYLDGLTGVANRRHFDERLDAEWRRAERDDTPMTVALVDVDFFKRYNDRYGHQAGDDCLRRVAGALAACLRRPGDLVARYGGEEFACILPATGLEAAQHLGAQLIDAVARLRLPHADSAAADIVTVSAGLAVKTGRRAGSADALVHAADAQLYRAKDAGRNQAMSGAMTAG